MSLKISALLGCLVLIPCAAHAADEGSSWYAGIGVGRADLGNMHSQSNPQFNFFDTTKTGYKLFGGYRFNANFALEGSYVDFGTHKGSATDEHGFTNPAPDSWKYSAYTIAAVGTLPLSGGFSVLGKAGVAIGKMGEYDSDGTTAVKRNQSLFLGVGMKYDFSKTLFMHAEYESFGTVGDSTSSPQSPGEFKPKMFSVSVGANF